MIPDMKFVATTCPYCGVGCGLLLAVRDERVVGVEPWQAHPINEGKLCQKGRYAHQFIHSEDRLKTPLIKRGGSFVPASWDEALQLIARRLSSYRPEEVFFLASAKATNEENYLFQKFARVVMKTNNVDHCARLCHSSTVSALAKAFGSGAMTNSILDLEEARCIFVIGSNTFEQHPLIGRRLVLARRRGAKVISADPRLTPTAKEADLHLPIRPGTDVALINGLVRRIIEGGWEDRGFIEERTRGFETLRETVMKEESTLPGTSRITGVPEGDIEAAAEMIATLKPAALLYSMGVTQHTSGVENVLALANLMMLTGNIGRPGSGVNPLRGQNNVQGACDMGALPNVFSGYQSVEEDGCRRRMKRVWGVEELGEARAGITSTEMMEILADRPGRMKALYLMGENPMISEADQNRVRRALDNVEFMVSQEIFMTETTELADVVLPAASFAEKDGTFTNTDRRVQRLRKAIDPPGEAMPDWEILSRLARAMGYGKMFDYRRAEDIFEEVARATPSYAGISYRRLEEPHALQWPCPGPHHPGTPILHVERFATPDGLGHFTPVEWRPPAEVPSEDYPLILTTGRSLWHWHAGSMTRRSKSLGGEVETGWVEMNEEDAEEMGIGDGEVVRVSSRRGRIELPARVTSEIKRGVIFVPFHFAECPANRLTNAALDPVSKIPEFKACAARVDKLRGWQHPRGG
ncbi:Formate dehydrogenase, alpha subunit (F420) [Methanothrix harundinacea 6Ac]|uniref:formate dehydrogenase (coenzyme F420) n=3 Tax=Methanothrix harundinacea TaxID=301375 RepID=G7WLW9_METH6|nr:formate dehydrogenase alpha subunit [Methanothrix harundinacea 6Ac]AET63712.1 Formate dehydrogenase, alpha subunit (F420) [Methanothrix harundinacea 6Ac]